MAKLTVADERIMTDEQVKAITDKVYEQVESHVLIINSNRLYNLQLDIQTCCAKAKTAVKRLFKDIDVAKYPEFDGIEEGILECIQGGMFSDTTEGSPVVWGVEFVGSDEKDNRWYAYCNVVSENIKAEAAEEEVQEIKIEEETEMTTEIKIQNIINVVNEEIVQLTLNFDDEAKNFIKENSALYENIKKAAYIMETAFCKSDFTGEYKNYSKIREKPFEIITNFEAKIRENGNRKMARFLSEYRENIETLGRMEAKAEFYGSKLEGKETDKVIKKFEVGKVYHCRGICDNYFVYTYTVLKHTEKIITLKDDTGNQYRKKIIIRDNEEIIYPEGYYAKAPILRASDSLMEIAMDNRKKLEKIKILAYKMAICKDKGSEEFKLIREDYGKARINYLDDCGHSDEAFDAVCKATEEGKKRGLTQIEINNTAKEEKVMKKVKEIKQNFLTVYTFSEGEVKLPLYTIRNPLGQEVDISSVEVKKLIDSNQAIIVSEFSSHDGYAFIEYEP